MMMVAVAAAVAVVVVMLRGGRQASKALQADPAKIEILSRHVRQVGYHMGLWGNRCRPRAFGEKQTWGTHARRRPRGDLDRRGCRGERERERARE
jgi:hypothetical protein